MADLKVETFQRRGEAFALLKLGPYAASLKAKLGKEIEKAHEAAKAAAAAATEPVAGEDQDYNTNGAGEENQDAETQWNTNSWEDNQAEEDTSTAKNSGKRANTQPNDQGRFQVKRRRGEDEDAKKKKWWEQQDEDDQATENKAEEATNDWKNGKNDNNNKWTKQNWWEKKDENQSWDKNDKWQKKDAKGKGKGKARDVPEDMDDGEVASGQGGKKGWGQKDDKGWNSKDQDWKNSKNSKWDWKQGGGWNKDEGNGKSKNSWGKKEEDAWESSAWDKKGRDNNKKSWPSLGDDLPGEKSAISEPNSTQEWIQAQDRLFGHMDKLPVGWIRIRSRKSQEIYYYSLKSGESREGSTPISSLPAASGGAGGGFGRPAAAAPAPAVAAAPVLPPDWTVHYSKSTGKPYYYNTKTGNSQFEPPM